MQKHVHPVLLVTLLMAAACSDKNSSPTSPSNTNGTQTLLSLNGIVSSVSDGNGLDGATVTIKDGVNAGQERTTDAFGRYTFTDLMPSSFTLQAAAAGHITQNKSVDLTTTNQGIGFALVKPDPIFAMAGTGDTWFTIPAYVRRVRIQGSYSGFSSQFVVWINEFLAVNVLLGTDHESTTFDGTYYTCAPCVTEIEHSSGVSWAFTEVR